MKSDKIKNIEIDKMNIMIIQKIQTTTHLSLV